MHPALIILLLISVLISLLYPHEIWDWFEKLFKNKHDATDKKL